MIRRLAAISLLFLVSFSPARGESLVIGLSTPEVKISSNFTGADVTVFGAIERDAETVSRPDTYDIAVVVRGPPESVVTWRKERFLGVWINRRSATFDRVPGFYSVTASRNLDAMAAPALLNRLQVGVDHLRLASADAQPASTDFGRALVRIRRDSGLYGETTGGVSFYGTSLFQAAVGIPANVAVGNYTATVYLFSGGQLLARAEKQFRIARTGFEQITFDFSRSQALTYGLACVVLALFVGWLAGVMFRRD